MTTKDDPIAAPSRREALQRDRCFTRHDERPDDLERLLANASQMTPHRCRGTSCRGDCCSQLLFTAI
jgi:hypothetical protein